MNKSEKFYSKRHELLCKYLSICDELWKLNKAYVQQNIDMLELESALLRNRPEENNDDDLPF